MTPRICAACGDNGADVRFRCFGHVDSNGTKQSGRTLCGLCWFRIERKLPRYGLVDENGDPTPLPVTEFVIDVTAVDEPVQIVPALVRKSMLAPVRSCDDPRAFAPRRSRSAPAKSGERQQVRVAAVPVLREIAVSAASILEITAEMRKRGYTYSRHAVSRLLKRHGIAPGGVRDSAERRRMTARAEIEAIMRECEFELPLWRVASIMNAAGFPTLGCAERWTEKSVQRVLHDYTTAPRQEQHQLAA